MTLQFWLSYIFLDRRSRKGLPHYRRLRSLNGFQLLIITLLILGIVFRFVNLDRKVYWHDEAYTSLRISGYTSLEARQQIFNGQVLPVQALDLVQHPSAQKNLFDTVKSLAVDDAQHPPLYYLLVWLWVHLFGSSITVIRSFSALVSVLVFPGLYWVCLEVFRSPPIAWSAIALVAISPFHVLYAQEAREYSLWTVMILLSSGLFLTALRGSTMSLPKQISIWGLYAFSLTLSLYTFPLSALVGVGHGLYLIAITGFRFTRSGLSYLAASLLAGLLFIPWLVASPGNRLQPPGVSWMSVPIPWPVWLKTWGLTFSRGFILTVGDFGFDDLRVYITLPLILGLVGYALYNLCRYTPLRIWLFVLTLMLPVALTLAIPDIILGGQRSTSSRYLVPFYLGLQIAIAHLLASKIMGQPGRRSIRWFWQGVAIVLVSVEVMSCAASSQAETTWNKVIGYNSNQIAHIINQAPAPLLVSDSFGINFGTILALSHQLEPKVRVQLFNHLTQTQSFTPALLPTQVQDMFFLNPPDFWRERIEKHYHRPLDLSFHDYHLWLWHLTSR